MDHPPAPEGPPSFLLIDDNAIFLDLLGRMIERSYPDSRIGRANTGAEALDQLIEGGWDVALLDYRLPDLDGIEVLAEVKKRSLDTAVVVVTGEGDERVAADLFRMGATDYLVKTGVSASTLHRCLEQVLLRRRLEEQIAAKSDALVTTSRELAERTRALDTAYDKLSEKKEQLKDLSASLETQVQLRTAELQATTAFLNQVLDSTTTHFIIATDAVGTILTFNAGAEALFGFREDDLVQSEHYRVLFAELLDDDEALAALEKDLDEGGIQRELTGLDERGRAFQAKVSIDPLGGEAARTGLVIVGSDVTHERELERQNQAYIEQIEAANRDLRRKNEQILEANRLKSEFLANVSHELRTPLNAIIGYSDLMLGGIYGDMPPRQESAVQGITDRARDLLALINDILDLAKIEAGAMELRVEKFQLGEVVRTVVETGRILAVERKLGVHWANEELAGELLRTDRQKLQQILVNLVNNAVKFTHQGSVTVRTALLPSGELECCVTDTGIGIPPADQEAIFDEFRQADGTSTRQYEGTGLGLAISRKLARGMGGDLTVASEVGKGSTFRLVMPVVLPGTEPGTREVPVALDPTVLLD